MTVEENIKVRECALEVYEFAVEVADTVSNSVRFWEILREFVSILIPKPEVVKGEWRGKSPMTDVESKRFGSQLIPFGEFVGRRVDEVPMDRLVWYAGQTFVDDLRRYLESPRIKREVSG